jgi:hypothetical protein
MQFLKLHTNLLLVPSFALLAACGGGDLTSIEVELTSSERATALLNAAEDTAAFIDGANVTDVENLPLDAPVQYSGAFVAAGGEGALEANPLVAYLGELDLEADFNTGDISGTATNFINIENPGAFLDEDADPTIGSDVTGTLDIAGTPSSDTLALFDITVDGDLSADDNTSNLGFDFIAGELAVSGANAEALFLEGGSDDGVIFNEVAGWLSYGGIAAQ